MMLKVKHCCCFFSFPSSSAGKESTCNAGDPGSNPGLGRAFWDRIGYPLQYSWASLVTQTVKKPAMWETWFDHWVGKMPWRKAWQPTPVFLPGESPMGIRPWGRKESDTTERLSTVALQASLCPWNFPWKKTGVGCHFLQSIFPTQGTNLHPLLGRRFFTNWAIRKASK